MSRVKLKIRHLSGLELAVRCLAFAYLLQAVLLNQASFLGRPIPASLPMEIAAGHFLVCGILVLLFAPQPLSRAFVAFFDLLAGASLLSLYGGAWAFTLPLFLAVFAAGLISWGMALSAAMTAVVLFIAGNVFRFGFSRELLFRPDFLMLLVLNLSLSSAGLLRSDSVTEKQAKDSLVSLIESGQELGSKLSYDQLFKLAFEVVKRNFSASTAVIYIKNADEVMQVRAADSPCAKLFPDFSPKVAKSALSSLIRDKQARLFEDVYQLPEDSEQILPRRKLVRSAMSAPLVFEGDSIGLLFIAGDLPKAYNAESLQLFIILANQLAVSYRNVQLHAATVEMAITDSVSGLYTHSHMQEVLENEFRRHKYGKLSLSIVIVDVDFFKIINDTYGHPQGDSLLKQLGGVLKTVVRASDVLCRYGGDEFLIVFPETTRLGAVLVAERLRQAVAEYEFVVGSKVVHIAVSAGVATFPEDVETKKDLIESADQALYRAKKEGRNKVCFGGS